MKNVSVTEFRKNLPSYLDKVRAGETVRVTRRGEVIAVLTPPENVENRAREKLEGLRARARVGDVVSPTGVTWEAEGAAS